jgi:hypothetical protein
MTDKTDDKLDRGSYLALADRVERRFGPDREDAKLWAERLRDMADDPERPDHVEFFDSVMKSLFTAVIFGER